MKKTILIVFLLLVTVSVFTRDLPQYAVDYDKEHWESWTYQDKITFVTGFAACFNAMVTELATNAYTEATQNYVIFINESLSGLNVGDIVRGVDALYETGRYDNVSVAGMILNIKDLVWRETNGND